MRLAEAKKEAAEWTECTYPIFFYNDMMFPGQSLSLHLFEPRYKLMMKRIVAGTGTYDKNIIVCDIK